MASNLIAIVAAIVGVGVIAQLLAGRSKLPSIIFLLAAGIILGPVLGWIDPESAFGDALSAIVGVAVAIIVFEGAFHLDIDRIRQASSETIRLVTIGAAISLIGTAAVVKFALNTEWSLAFLIGALLVATGPTVIKPILRVVPVRDQVGTALDTEGIVNDVTAALIAVVVFEAIIAGGKGIPALVRIFTQRLGAGLLIGAGVAVVVYAVIRYVDLSPENAPQNARLLTLAGALVAFASADLVAKEAGIAAVAAAGLILGNVDLPYEKEIAAFKGDITMLVLSFIFISLAALLEFDQLAAIGIPGLLVVAAVTLVIRPVLVMLSTTGGRFTMGERWFMSLVGPRGIIPASVATLFAVELSDPQYGLVAEADILVGTVFLVILMTVIFQAGLAKHIADFFDIIPMRVIIIGGGQVGRTLANRLEARGENVVIIENDETNATRARKEGYTVTLGDGTETDILTEAGTENAKIVVAATGDDDVNLLVSQLAATKFGVERIIARANNPDNAEAFEELGVETVSTTLSTAWTLDNLIERPALAKWLTELGEAGDVQEVEVTADEIIGKTIRELESEVPEGCLIGLVSRNGETEIPSSDLMIEAGDHITFLGRTAAVLEAMNRFHPTD